ncbi:MAG: arylsulfatase [Planctomycetes bacterium]|nr:arylsulfatase [Planctomycetota bacterium]
MRKPNLLLIVTDQQRGDCLSVAGHPNLATPNLDRLAGEGAYFPHAYTEVPSCIPARRILMTGLNQASSGMVGMSGFRDWDPPQTIPGELSKAGYQTHLVGKLHLYPLRKRYGFHSMTHSDGPLGNLGPMEPLDAYHRFLQRNGHADPERALAHGLDVNGWVARPWHLEERLHFTTWCVDEAIDYLQRRDPTQPFFLKLSIFAPHPPLIPPQSYYDRYMQMDLPPAAVGDWVDEESIPRTGPDMPSTASWRVRMDPATLKRCRAAYYGLINHIDDQLGRLQQYMRRAGLWNDTFVVMTSDHGEMLGDHHLYRKCWPYEASSRVPFLVRAPKWMECKQGLKADPVVGLQDVLPTLLDAAGVPIPNTVDGRSVLPVLRGEKVKWREYIHCEHAGQYEYRDGVMWVTDGKEKFVWYTQRGEEQFFDLEKDPNECRNLVNVPRSAERVALWRGRMIDAIKARPEGFTDGKRLIAGRPHKHYVPGKEPPPVTEKDVVPV